MNDLGKVLSHLIERDIILSIIKRINYYSKKIPVDYYDINFKKAIDNVIDVYGGVIIRDDADIYYQINFNNNFNEYNEMVIINRLNDLNEKYNFADYEQFFNDDVEEVDSETNIQQSLPELEAKKDYDYDIEEIYTSLNRIERIINNKLSNKLKEHNNKFNIIMENIDSLNNLNNNIEKIVANYINNEIVEKFETLKGNIIDNKFEDMFIQLNSKIDNLLSRVDKIIEFNNKQQPFNEKLISLLGDNNINNSIRNDLSEYLQYYKPINNSRNDIIELIQEITKSNSSNNKIVQTDVISEVINDVIDNKQLTSTEETSFDDFINSLNNAEKDFVELTENIKTIPIKSNRRIKYDRQENKKIIPLRNDQNNVYLDPKVKSCYLKLENPAKSRDNEISTKSKGINMDFRSNEQ